MTQPFLPTWQRAEVAVGIGPGNGLYWPLQNNVLPNYVTAIDWTTVTRVFFTVTRQSDASVDTWDAGNLISVTTAGLVAVFTFGSRITVAPYECYIAGQYLLRPWAVTPSAPGGIPCQQQVLHVNP